MINGTTNLPTTAFRYMGLILLTVFLCSSANNAQAATITAYSGATGPGLGSVIFGSVSTPSDGNDNVVGTSPNLLIIDQKSFSTSAYIDIVFNVMDFGVPTCEYAVSEFVYNGTSDNWIGYQVKLGFGTGASFVSAGLGTGLDFDTPDYDSPMDFSPYTVGSFDDVTITVGGATVVPTSNMLFQFTIDVPSGITEFTLRQEPRVEPISAELKAWGDVKSLFR
jgi:hypothetical protein